MAMRGLPPGPVLEFQPAQPQESVQVARTLEPMRDSRQQALQVSALVPQVSALLPQVSALPPQGSETQQQV